MSSVEEMLIEFHTAMELPVRTTPITEFDPFLWNLRRTLHNEETKELKNAMSNENNFDLVEIADGICDTIVVVTGTAVSFGIPLMECFREVQRSNMSKLGDDGKPIIREDGKRMKGPNFSPPDLKSIIYG